MSTITDPEHISPSTVRKHPIYWFEDGTLTLEVGSQHFLVHRTLLSRHSRVLSKSDTPCISLRSSCRAEDLEALLQCLYHDRPLRNDSPFSHVASVLRITSPSSLDFPYFHAMAHEIIEGMFSETPSAFSHDHPLSDALALASDFDLRSVRKAILYALVTTREFDVSDDDDGRGSLDPQIEANPDSAETTTSQPSDLLSSDNLGAPTTSTPSHTRDVLFSKDLARTCTKLLSRIIEHFTPLLFTCAATPHMECTDVFAETWGPMVIMPAIEDNGVYKPLETLERLKEIDWAKHGLCPSCVKEKRKEWTDEQMNVWDLMGRWLSDPESDAPDCYPEIN